MLREDDNDSETNDDSGAESDGSEARLLPRMVKGSQEETNFARSKKVLFKVRISSRFGAWTQ